MEEYSRLQTPSSAVEYQNNDEAIYEISVWSLEFEYISGQKKKICVFTVTCWKKLGSVGRKYFFF